MKLEVRASRTAYLESWTVFYVLRFMFRDSRFTVHVQSYILRLLIKRPSVKYRILSA